jgi:DNA mismatch repair protein MutS
MKHWQESAILQIDNAARRSLELVETLEGEKQGSLLHTIDHTLTAHGARLLFQRIQAPICDRAEIEHRLELVMLSSLCSDALQVSFFVSHKELRERTRALLKLCKDMQRSLQRLKYGEHIAANSKSAGWTKPLREI